MADKLVFGTAGGLVVKLVVRLDESWVALEVVLWVGRMEAMTVASMARLGVM